MWNEVKVDSKIKPTERRRTCMSSHGDIIYIFGGYDDEGYIGGFFSFNTITNHWKEIKLKKEPSKRSGHSSVIIKNNFYLIGGETVLSNGETCLLNDIWKYDIKNNFWELKTNISFDFIQKSPSPRFFHSLCSLYDKYIFLFGGFDKKECFNDMYFFDVDNTEWDTILLEDQFGVLPKPMLSHSSIGYLDSVFIYGGEYLADESVTKKQNLYEFNFYKKHWKKIDLKTFPPRSNTSMCLFDHFILFFGGFDEEGAFQLRSSESSQYFYNDVHIFDIWNSKLTQIENQTEKKMNERRKSQIMEDLDEIHFPLKRTKHSSAIVRDKFYVFGGVDSNFGENMNDLCCFQIPKNFNQNYQFLSKNLFQNLKDGEFGDVDIHVC